ncbi:hypothetical protein F5X96DRAFT_279735 [Biscogniauxia mediterranea]|nr:hypothetical protein F5X96DRAFT_279735 [Biscogniauxia mediterranea]
MLLTFLCMSGYKCLHALRYPLILVILQLLKASNGINSPAITNQLIKPWYINTCCMFAYYSILQLMPGHTIPSEPLNNSIGRIETTHFVITDLPTTSSLDLPPAVRSNSPT